MQFLQKKKILFTLLIAVSWIQPHKIFSQTISAEQSYAMNSPGIVNVQTTFTATVYVNKVEINQRRFDRLVDSVRKLDTTGTILSPEQKLDIVIKELYSAPLRFFSGTGDYLMQEHKIVSSGTGFFISNDGYLITNCHVIDRDSSFIRQKFILSTFKEVTDANIRSLQSAWGMMMNDEQKNLLYNTYSFVYSRVSSMILFDLKKDINVLYRVDDEDGDPVQQTKKAVLIRKGKPMPGKDVALLKIDDGTSFPMLTMSNDSIVNIGEQVLVCGYPEPVTNNAYLSSETSIEPTLTSGIISAIKKSLIGWPVIQMDAAISHGSSGSPVFNEKGEVIGVATFGSLEQKSGDLASGFNFAIPVSVIKEFIDTSHIRLQIGKASILYNEGLDFFYKENFREALKDFEKVKQLNKNYPGLFYYIKSCNDKIAEIKKHSGKKKKYWWWAIAGMVLVGGLYFFYWNNRKKRS